VPRVEKSWLDEVDLEVLSISIYINIYIHIYIHIFASPGWSRWAPQYVSRREVPAGYVCWGGI